MAKVKTKITDLSVLRELLEDNILGLSLLEKAEYMQKTLKDLEVEIDAKGVITEMPQGNYAIERANPALQAYNVTIKNYTTIVKQLNEMIPDKKKNFDEFEDF